jgi:hypothetical protein
MARYYFHGPEKDGCQLMEGQSKEPRSMQAYGRGGQGPSRAVELFEGKNENQSNSHVIYIIVWFLKTPTFIGAIVPPPGSSHKVPQNSYDIPNKYQHTQHSSHTMT